MSDELYSQYREAAKQISKKISRGRAIRLSIPVQPEDIIRIKA